MTHVRITITGREVTQRRRNAVVTGRIGPKAIARTMANGGITNGFSEMIRRFLSRSSTTSAMPLTSEFATLAAASAEARGQQARTILVAPNHLKFIGFAEAA